MKINYFMKHWKLGLHYILRTRYFGVNNQWFSSRASFAGVPIYKQMSYVVCIVPLWKHYQAMKIRLGPATGFIGLDQYHSIFGQRDEK